MIDDDENYPDWFDEIVKRIADLPPQTFLGPPSGHMNLLPEHPNTEIDLACDDDLIVECWTENSWYFYIDDEWHKCGVIHKGVLHPDEIEFLEILGQHFPKCVNLTQSAYKCADGSHKYGTPMYITTSNVTDREYRQLFRKYGDLEYRDRSDCADNVDEYWDKILHPQFEAELHPTDWHELFKPLSEIVEEMPVYDGT